MSSMTRNAKRPSGPHEQVGVSENPTPTHIEIFEHARPRLLGVAYRIQEGKIVATVSFAFDRSDRVTDIFIVRNPDKLAGLGDMSIH